MKLNNVKEYLKDSKLKNTKFAIFIREYSIVLSLVIIIFGVGLIFYPPYEKNTSSIIAINPSSDKISSPIDTVFITMEYKLPFACGEHPKAKEIRMWSKPNITRNITTISLKLGGSESSVYSSDFELNPKYSKILYKEEYTGDEVRSFEPHKFDEILSNSNRYDTFEYTLNYVDAVNETFTISGNGTLISDDFYNYRYPLVCMDPVTEAAVDYNKTILRLTGILMILGAFPFFHSLKQLLKESERD
jgi:disulfide oxidoreductase YuzD